MSNGWRFLATALITLLLGAVALPSAAADGAVPAVTDPHFVRLQIDAISPSMVTSASTAPLTVSGLVINDGDRDVKSLQVRLERAPAVRSASELRTALRSGLTESAVNSTFVTVADELSPGQSTPFSLSLPLTGSATDSLLLTETGVYPMLVNVNGTPDYGGRARLDAGHFLLPVLSLPPAERPPGAAAPPVPEPEQPVPAPPVGITVLWPLADRPRLRPSALGTPPLLSDDELATSFAAGGRLDGLLTAVQQRTDPAADPAGTMASSLCLGVDPDLLVTAEAMTRGYLVMGPDGETTPGSGGAAAGAWLQRLKAATKQRCVIALPWAQADLNALSRAKLSTLEASAVSGPAAVAQVLGLAPLPPVTWPVGGLLAERTAADLQALGTKTALVSTDGVNAASGSALGPGVSTAALKAATAPVASAPLGATLIDAASAGALVETGPGDHRTLRLQDAVGALAWPAISTARQGVDQAEAAPATVLVAPPQVWNISAADAETTLATVSALLASGAARAVPLTTTLAASTARAPQAVLNYPVQAAAAEVSPDAVAAIGRTVGDVRDFGRALEQDPQSGVSPTELLAPLQLDLLRAVSATPSPPPTGDGGQLDAVRAELRRLRDGVTLQAPSGIYTLASTQSPLLLVVHNDLAVAINVRLTVEGPAGLEASDIGVQQLPARSARQLQVPTSVTRTGQFAVDVSLTTETGQQLGEPARLQVRSTAYGAATALATAGAAALLLALIARRLWHRFRGQADRADKLRGHP